MSFWHGLSLGPTGASHNLSLTWKTKHFMLVAVFRPPIVNDSDDANVFRPTHTRTRIRYIERQSVSQWACGTVSA